MIRLSILLRGPLGYDSVCVCVCVGGGWRGGGGGGGVEGGERAVHVESNQ